MTTTTLIIIGVAVVILLAVAIARGSGPRVTQIDRTIRKRQSEGDER